MYFQAAALLLFSSLAMRTLAMPLHARQAPNCTAIDDIGLEQDDVDLLKDMCERISMSTPLTRRLG